MLKKEIEKRKARTNNRHVIGKRRTNFVENRSPVPLPNI